MEMLLAEAPPTSWVGLNEYNTSQNTSGSLQTVKEPEGDPITRGDILTAMFLFIMVMENRAKAGGFGGGTVRSVITNGQVALEKGRAILRAFIENTKRADGLGRLDDVKLALQAVKTWSKGGADNGVSGVRQFFGANDGKVLYWKAVVQNGKVRSWRKNVDVTRVARTDFSTSN